MNVEFNAVETEEIIVNGMEAMGFHNIDPDSLDVSVKSPRDGSGKSHIAVSFERMKKKVYEQSPQPELVEADKPGDDTTEDSPTDTEEEYTSTGAGLFTGGSTS